MDRISRCRREAVEAERADLSDRVAGGTGRGSRRGSDPTLAAARVGLPRTVAKPVKDKDAVAWTEPSPFPSPIAPGDDEHGELKNHHADRAHLRRPVSALERTAATPSTREQDPELRENVEGCWPSCPIAAAHCSSGRGGLEWSNDSRNGVDRDRPDVAEHDSNEATAIAADAPAPMDGGVELCNIGWSARVRMSRALGGDASRVRRRAASPVPTR